MLGTVANRNRTGASGDILTSPNAPNYLRNTLSGGGERVVAEPGQDVAGLPEDLAGLGQGGALAVLAGLDLRIITVVGGRGPGMGLAGLIHRPAQARRALPGQPPGRAPGIGGAGGDIQPGEPDRLAGGGEPGRPRTAAPPAPSPRSGAGRRPAARAARPP